MQESDTLNVKRRQLLKLSGALAGGIALVGLNRSALADMAPGEAPFVTPTADHPIRINFNENPLGMSPKAQAAARDAVVKANRYAKDEIIALRNKLASQYQVPDTAILLTAGSSEGIRAAVEAYATLDTQLVIPELTYGDGEHFAKIAGMKITKVPMLDGWQFDINGLKQAVANYDGPSLVYLVNPNNPTATITPADLIEPWIATKPPNTLFIVDEAYAEFVNDPRFRSVGPLFKQGADNIILLKTFSKIFAMAGMRVGYAVAQPAIIARLANHVAGEKINFCGVDAALASLDDRAFIAYSKKSNDTSRQILLDALKALNIPYLPSEGNFVFHQLGVPLKEYQQHMKEAGILIGRAFPPADAWCRISLGTPQEMTFVAKTLHEFRAKGWV
ncbi:pyridoxal phosphate-dependent aminotransferase [Serratia liquefaciens]|uniref:pyridoxal phosphate-dependent aminotransferase n=1 Tax=Serratia liquefaciens TaxID=614 RepID=UPI0022DDEA68|nr:aminotransferase class I/II-fold pyridoxal phosphate-dependent enzyme [Serratia liquefaciens]WBL72818.1 aminotransferase class I/II-fold pyridoxal phosphate-dependent enzyme [Serratia liquefaciens]